MRFIVVFSSILFLLTVASAQTRDTTRAQEPNSRATNGKQSNGDGAVQAPDAFFVGAGTGVLDNLQAKDWSVQFVAGRQWNLNRYFTTKGFMEATTDFNESVLASALIGGTVYPVRSVVAPYIGAGAGLGYARAANDADAFGLGLSSTFGILMFQESPLKVNVETNANFLFRGLIDDKMPMSFTIRSTVLF